MAAPFRIRRLFAAAARDLWRQADATLIAVAGAVAAALAARLAVRGAAAALTRLVADRPFTPFYAGAWAILIAASGLGCALLLRAVTRAAALSRYAGDTAWSGLVRAPAFLAIDVLELILDATLGVAALLLITQHLHHFGSAAQSAWSTTILLMPLAVPLLLGFAMARVAQCLVARGLPLGLALVHGCDVALRRFPSLAKLLVTTLLLAGPLWLIAALLPFIPGVALAAMAALWSYATLIRFVGADARLSIG